MAYPINYAPFTNNRTPIMNGLSSVTNTDTVPIAVDPLSGSLLVQTYVFNGTSWEQMRTANTYKTGVATASGSTALWTPATGKKFRLMGYDMQITSNATQAVAGVLVASLYDGTTATAFAHSIYVPSAAGQANFFFDSGWHDLSNGYLSLAANNALNINLSSTLATGEVRFVVMGCEE